MVLAQLVNNFYFLTKYTMQAVYLNDVLIGVTNDLGTLMNQRHPGARWSVTGNVCSVTTWWFRVTSYKLVDIGIEISELKRKLDLLIGLVEGTETKVDQPQVYETTVDTVPTVETPVVSELVTSVIDEIKCFDKTKLKKVDKRKPSATMEQQIRTFDRSKLRNQKQRGNRKLYTLKQC